MIAMPMTSPAAPAASQAKDATPLSAPDGAMADFAAKAAQAASLLASLGHPSRLMVLCHLGHGEMSVSQINRHVPMSQPALSQHLARLRGEGLVATRRRGATIFYRIANPAVLDIIDTLRRFFCPAPGQENAS